MPNERLKKYLNDIVWWIPSRKLRDFIREIFSIIYEIKGQNDLLLNNYLLSINGNTKYIVTPVNGGFVDQLNIYRIGYSIENYYNKKVLYDIFWYNYNGKDSIKNYNRNFELMNIFNDFDFKIATDKEIQIAKINTINARDYTDIDIRYLFANKFIYFFDNGPNIKMKCLSFNEIFDLDKYILPKLDNDNKKIYEDIKNCKHSVACHVRRNDYLKVDFRRYSLDENYFIKAIEKINKQIR
ncbi:hypothetical protein [Brachyspira aalborgi]|uniref:Alpha-1,2-fucosyltransferase n=1 Tax=Brachyspira aalborgi TaxID=29522 RepID=A0A5C8CL31_9SPIR|nr:hypothetical protein [Brachyspira aalborgi]TXJ13616.1 hypothetical protein EPJ80_02435 [Brachyspira aalborgi]